MDADEIVKVQTALGSDRAAIVTTSLIGLVGDDIAEHLTNRGVDTTKCHALIRRIVLIRLNVQGSEGVASESYSGISQTFMQDLPGDIKDEIRNLRAVRF